MDKHFFDTMRADKGQLKQHQVDGAQRIIAYAQENGYSKDECAYCLATAWHETGGWMQPIREGALRYGPNYSNESAIRAVTAIFNKGIIRTNYALPAGPYGKNYYGRGLVQITWYDNYLKFEKILDVPLVQYPDLALEWQHALPIMFRGITEGHFRSSGKGPIKLSDFAATLAGWTAARNVVNGDVSKHGYDIAQSALKFSEGLKNYVAVDKTTESNPAKPASKYPAWWPFKVD